MIDPTARVAESAVIGDGVDIGPYCVVGPHVKLGNGVRLIAHVTITGATTIGDETIVYPHASLGTPPQSVHYKGEPTQLLIGSRCQLREGVTMNIGTAAGGGITRIGDRGFFMVGTHVAHDCQIGNDVVFANLATLGGHVTVGDNAFFGGHTAIHQFAQIGEGAMMGGMSAIREDIIPFGTAVGNTASLVGLNLVGLRRRQVGKTQLHQLRRAYRSLFFGEGPFSDRVKTVAEQHAGDLLVMKIVAFIRGHRQRALMQPRSRHPIDEPAGDVA